MRLGGGGGEGGGGMQKKIFNVILLCLLLLLATLHRTCILTTPLMNMSLNNSQRSGHTAPPGTVMLRWPEDHGHHFGNIGEGRPNGREKAAESDQGA